MKGTNPTAGTEIASQALPSLALEDHVFRIIEGQVLLREFLGTYTWDYNMDGGLLTFRPAGREPFAMPTQIIGTSSEKSSTWLWSYANKESGIPDALVEGSWKVRDAGRREALEEFISMSPIEFTEKTFPLEMAIIASGFLGHFTYHSCKHSGGTMFASIPEKPDIAGFPGADTLTCMRALQSGLLSFKFDHRKALMAYLGEPRDEHGSRMSFLSPSGEEIHFEFDASGRVLRMGTDLDGRNQVTGKGQR